MGRMYFHFIVSDPAHSHRGLQRGLGVSDQLREGHGVVGGTLEGGEVFIGHESTVAAKVLPLEAEALLVLDRHLFDIAKQRLMTYHVAFRR